VRLGTGSDAATLYNPSQVEKDTPMHVFGAFELDIRPGTPDNPASVRIALLRYTRGEDGRLFMTPECESLVEVEGEHKVSWGCQ
jgi:hypothetical protein